MTGHNAGTLNGSEYFRNHRSPLFSCLKAGYPSYPIIITWGNSSNRIAPKVMAGNRLPDRVTSKLSHFSLELYNFHYFIGGCNATVPCLQFIFFASDYKGSMSHSGINFGRSDTRNNQNPQNLLPGMLLPDIQK